MNIKHGDKVEIEGFVGEVLKVTDSYIEVLYGGDSLHYCTDEYDTDDKRVTLSEEKYIICWVYSCFGLHSHFKFKLEKCNENG